MKRPAKKPVRRKPSLREQVEQYLDGREDCLRVYLDVPGRALLVMRRAEYTAIEKINEAGFQPYEKRREVVAPLGLILVFGPGWSDEQQQQCAEVGLDVAWPRTVADVEAALR